ncbi:7-carboxy-7-deazaguanine synthase QueE [Coralliovum pocilloporae]|uniref:7-carboxy-7-deazaguanine synthase QueE n=1 Tax=Coralliovum pocilloporae TaxID=3066369 RepID=UPI003307B09C
MTAERIRISEIFGPTIQGEGALIGRPTVFVRTGGCDFRCSWCDTIYAVDSAFRHDWKPMSAEAILDDVERLSGGEPILITLSGGNPAIQPLGGLLRAGHERGHSFAMETQGSLAKDWFAQLDYLTLSPKPPSSAHTLSDHDIEACLDAAGDHPESALKFVVFDETDYQFAKQIAAQYPSLSVYLQPGNRDVDGLEQPGEPDQDGLMSKLEWLVERVAEDRWFKASVLPQLHVVIWGGKRGV